MALQVDFELDGTKHLNCYLKISKVKVNSVDYEHYELGENGTTIVLKYVTKLQSSALAQVWVDSTSRENRALPLKTFNFDFEYSLDSPKNIIQQAYESLKTAKEFEDAVDV